MPRRVWKRESPLAALLLLAAALLEEAEKLPDEAEAATRLFVLVVSAPCRL